MTRKDANCWRRALETAIPWLEAANAETFHSSELAAMALGFRRALGPIASSIPWDGVLGTGEGLREALEAIARCAPAHDKTYWAVSDPAGVTGADCQQMAWARETALAALAGWPMPFDGRLTLEAALTPTGDHHALPDGYCLDCRGQCLRPDTLTKAAQRLCDAYATRVAVGNDALFGWQQRMDAEDALLCALQDTRTALDGRERPHRHVEPAT